MPREELRLGDGRRVVVRHDILGFSIALVPSAARHAAPGVAEKTAALPAPFREAVAAHGMTIDDSLTATAAPLPPGDPVGPRTRPIEVAIDPMPGHTHLLAVERDGVVQWFVPVNASRVLPIHAGVLRAGDVHRARDAAARPVALDADQSLRFLVPAALVVGVVEPEPLRSKAARAERTSTAVFHLIRIPIVSDLVDAALGTVQKFIVEHVDTKREGFRAFDPANGSPFLDDAALAAMRDQRVLLLTHGIFSTIGAFDDLQGTTLAHLRTVYGARIIGWEHRTVAKTPLDNADELLSKLPPGITPDLICHSRGGLVMRAALEYPDLQAKRETRFSSAGTVLHVAGANQGSQLATFSHVNDLLNVFSAFASLPELGQAGVDLGVVLGLLKVLAHVAANLPSVKALSTDDDNQFIEKLDLPPHTRIAQLLVSRANYDPTGNAALAALNLALDKVFASANDFVVPFDGARDFDAGVHLDGDLPFGSDEQPQSVVFHTNFFRQPALQQFIAEHFV